MKLAILIATLKDGAIVNRPGGARVGNADLLNRVLDELNKQIAQISGHDVKIFLDEDSGEQTTGKKRNNLVEGAVIWSADGHAFVDDDDLVGPTYIQRGIEFLESGMDCAELWGQIYFNGKKGNPFHHFIDCRNPVTGKIEWWQDNQFYYRMPNHLNFVRTNLVKDILFPDQVFGEDGQQSERMRDAGVLKTEFRIPEVIYHYFCGQPKHEV